MDIAKDWNCIITDGSDFPDRALIWRTKNTIIKINKNYG
jgi:hypothetical protein